MGGCRHAAMGNALNEKLGEVNFPVSCNRWHRRNSTGLWRYFIPSGSTRQLNRSKGCFTMIPNVAWLTGNCHHVLAIHSRGPPDAKAWMAGASSVKDAQQPGVKSERERDYIAALAAFSGIGNQRITGHGHSLLKKQWKDWPARNPGDIEAQIHMLSYSTLQQCRKIKPSPTSAGRQISLNRYSRDIQIILESLTI